MSKNRLYIWLLIEFTNGDKQWYCVSRVLREGILMERRTNRFWKSTLIGNYITVAKTEYHHDRAQLTVGKITKINLSPHGTAGPNWTRNQFITREHLLDFQDAYNYLKHDYTWYNRLAIWYALKIWHNELVQTENRKVRKKINRARYKVKQQSEIAATHVIQAKKA